MLVAQTSRISQEACDALEEKITLEELHAVAAAMPTGKVLDKDKIPVKFYLILWDEIGPILLDLLREPGS